MTGRVVFHEHYGSTSLERDYLSTENGNIKVVEKKNESFQSLGHFFRSVFLPQGYPESVSEDYLIYQIYDTIQAFASSITGTLATQALLKGVGVGDESATAIAATITWILKDGTGMIGRILFAWLRGSSLDCDAKRWRLFADMLNDLAIFLEISAPYFGAFFTPIVCTAGVCKSIVGVAGGCTRAALTLHQARRNNMADVSAKDGSQETLVNLAAMICSLLLVPLVSDNPGLVWILFMIFTSIHIWANYSAVTNVIMESLNQARLHILVKDFFSRDHVSLPSIKETNYREPVIISTRWLYGISIGTPLEKTCDKLNELQLLGNVYSEEKYVLGVSLKSRQIHIALRDDSDIYEHIQAAFQAEVINVMAQMYANDNHSTARPPASIVNDNAINEILCSNFNTALNEGNSLEVSRASLQLTKNIFPAFYSELKHSGWNMTYVLLEADEWRAAWGNALNDIKNK